MSSRIVGVLVCAIAVTLAAGVANAEIVGTYVDATMSNTTPSSAFSVTESDYDNLWYVDAGRTYCENGDIMAANTGTETCPMLTTTVTGLTNGSYDVYAVYWTHSTAMWAVDAAVVGGPTVACNQWNGTPTGVTTEDKLEYQILLGQVNVTGGSFTVNVAPREGYDRGWYDGVSYQAVPAPEPSAVALVGMGAISLLAYAWRRRK
jgi:hypothetical protein